MTGLLRRAIEWCGFTPSHRERLLAARLASAVRAGDSRRLQVQRLERLLAYRVGLGATSLDVDSVRAALDGDEGPRP